MDDREKDNRETIATRLILFSVLLSFVIVSSCEIVITWAQAESLSRTTEFMAGMMFFSMCAIGIFIGHNVRVCYKNIIKSPPPTEILALDEIAILAGIILICKLIFIMLF